MDLTATLGLDAARALDPAPFAIGGVAPRLAVRPAAREELSEILAACTRDRLATVPWGGGTGLAHMSPPPRYDIAIQMSAFDKIVDYDPEDMTITAECGATLASLAAALAARGQELPIEGGETGRATLGGALAANSSGARRLRFGSPRDRVLGASFALSDGTIARTGGRVVKNVAGYGIHRLLCGSRGALAALVQASLKLVPAPEARRALLYDATAHELRDASRWTFLPRLEPAAVVVLGRDAARATGAGMGDSFTVVIALEDDRPWLEQQSIQIRSALGAAREVVEGGAVPLLLQAITDLVEARPSGAGTQALTLVSPWNSPAALGVVLDDPASPGLVQHSLAGRVHLELGLGAPSTVPRLAESGFIVIEHRGGAAPEPALPPFRAVLALRDRIRRELDPGAVWAYGDEWQHAT
jgi:FAD/FMN-containing dehydrogenase